MVEDNPDNLVEVVVAVVVDTLVVVGNPDNPVAEQVVVLPYFLSAGRHVVTDIPEEVEKTQSLRPDADIRTVSYLGSAEAVLDVLMELANGI